MQELIDIIKRLRSYGHNDFYIANTLFEDLRYSHFEIEVAMNKIDLLNNANTQSES